MGVNFPFSAGRVTFGAINANGKRDLILFVLRQSPQSPDRPTSACCGERHLDASEQDLFASG